MGDNTDEEMFEDWEEVRAGYRRKDEELASMENHQLFGYMQDNERLFSQVAAPQEAVMDAMLIKHLSRLCRQQAEQMSANIAQFRQEECVERLVASMRGEGGGQPLARRKCVMLGQQAKVFFKRSLVLTCMYGALDTTPPPLKEKKTKDPKYQ